MKPLSLHANALAALCLAVPAWAFAGPGHDHGEASVGVSVLDAPRRLPSGEIFLPKAAQRKLGVRTTLAALAEHPRAFELTGRVIADPAASGRVQSTQAGRLVAGPAGIPRIGHRVKRGELIGYVEPSIGAVERGSQAAPLADLRAQLETAKRRQARVEQLEGALPQKDIDAARIDVEGLAARIAALGGAVASREALRAPVAGVIAVANVVAGQVVDAREILFEIVDPSRLLIEALAYDEAHRAGIAQASVAAADGAVRLRFLGAGAQLREQAQPLLFAAERALGLAVGQPVRIAVQSNARLKAVALPATALSRSPSNETIVWVHAGAESFAPRVVTARPLDGARVAIEAGLKDGERIVVEGAQFVGQVR